MTKRSVTIDDLHAVRLVADPNVAPDGNRIAFVVTTVDRDKNGYRSAIWMVGSAADDVPFQFTSGLARDSSPRWSPDGSHLAFLSSRDERNQVFVMPADGGEAWRVTNGPHAVSEFSWAPDGQSLYFVTKEEPDEKPASDTKVIRTLRYKFDGEGFWDGKRRQIYRVTVNGGEPEQVTSGDWDSTQPTPSADGQKLAFVSNRSEDRDANSKSDVWLLDIGSSDLQRMTPEDGVYGAPSWSPDSNRLAYVGYPVVEPYGPTTLADLYVWDTATDEHSRLLVNMDREPGNSAISDSRYGVPNPVPNWTADSSAILSLISDRGSAHIYTCPLDGAPKLTIGEVRDIQSFTVADNGTVTFAASAPTRPTEVFVVTPDGNERQLSHVNAAFLEEVELGEVEEVQYESDPGVHVHGWLVKPPGLNESARYPAIIEVHGGPHGMYGTGFFHEMQVLAAQGYVVLMTNPRGSTGYGQEWVAATLSDWGGADYRDVEAGVPFLESLPYVDPERIGITGGSYGGYITNWAIGHTDRFKAAVTQRSTCNRISLYGTSDLNAMYNDWEYGGTPYDNPELYLERSPLTYVKNVRTPLLILHSENDLRCPIGQSEELFVALKKLGQDVEFVRFPDESHGLSRAGQPVHRVERLERICGWFAHYL
jgi:dipeptidyl aminopeptidase/acylaminoacyl peptidase